MENNHDNKLDYELIHILHKYQENNETEKFQNLVEYLAENEMHCLMYLYFRMNNISIGKCFNVKKHFIKNYEQNLKDIIINNIKKKFTLRELFNKYDLPEIKFQFPENIFEDSKNMSLIKYPKKEELHFLLVKDRKPYTEYIINNVSDCFTYSNILDVTINPISFKCNTQKMEGNNFDILWQNKIDDMKIEPLQKVVEKIYLLIMEKNGYSREDIEDFKKSSKYWNWFKTSVFGREEMTGTKFFKLDHI